MATKEYSERISVEYAGKLWHRYPNAKKASDRNYFRDSFGCKLHRTVWEDANGPIPDGYDIHHKDENPLNNDISNLECLTRLEHRQRHPVKDLEKARAHMAEVRAIGADWHKSEEAKPSKARASRIGWEQFEPVSRVCQHCLSPFLDKSRTRDAAFCSANCRSYVQSHSDKYQIDGACVVCGLPFRHYKYSTTLTCSRSCGMRLAHRTRRSRAA